MLELANQLIAYANTNGGYLHAQATDLAEALQFIQPTLTLPTTTTWLPRGAQLHAALDGTVYIETRQGIHTLQDGQSIQQLGVMKQVGDFEQMLVRGTYRHHLDSTTLDDDQLLAMGALNAAGHPTVLGILLYSAVPQRWLHYAHVRVVRYPARRATVQQQETMAEVVEMVTDLPMPALLDQAYALLANDLAVFPVAVWQEILLNAIVHREYRIQAPISVYIYTDCIEIVSPGGLAGYVTELTLAQHILTRNPLLKRYLAQLGYGEQGGLVALTASLKNCPQPTYTSAKTHFSVTLYTETAQAEDVMKPFLNQWNPVQKQILQHITEWGSISERELRTLFPHIPVLSLQEQLDPLLVHGVLRKLTLKSTVTYIPAE